MIKKSGYNLVLPIYIIAVLSMFACNFAFHITEIIDWYLEFGTRNSIYDIFLIIINVFVPVLLIAKFIIRKKYKMRCKIIENNNIISKITLLIFLLLFSFAVLVVTIAYCCEMHFPVFSPVLTYFFFSLCLELIEPKFYINKINSEELTPQKNINIISLLYYIGAVLIFVLFLIFCFGLNLFNPTDDTTGYSPSIIETELTIILVPLYFIIRFTHFAFVNNKLLCKCSMKFNVVEKIMVIIGIVVLMLTVAVSVLSSLTYQYGLEYAISIVTFIGGLYISFLFISKAYSRRFFRFYKILYT